MDPRIVKTRNRVLASATALMVDAGPSAVTVDAVVDHSGVAKSTIYRHWASRDDLLRDVFFESLPEPTAPDLTQGFELALRSFIISQAEVFADPEWARLIPSLLSLRVHEPEIAKMSDEDRAAKHEVILSILDLGIAEGYSVTDLDPSEVALSLIGPLVFAVLMDQPSGVEFAERLVDRFVAGLRPV